MINIDVLLVCYNQEAFIKDAIESVLIQRLPEQYFVNIIIADDCSTDSTLEIIKSIEINQLELSEIDITDKQNIYVNNRYKFIYQSSKENLGISKNYLRSFRLCKGEYIAIIEGDDYWSSPFHLLQHIKFLDFHRECSMSMNNMTICIHETGEFIEQWWPYPESFHMISTKEQISMGNKLGNLSACVMRRKCIDKLPDSMFEMPMADWMLGVMLSQQGYLALLKLSTSVYRKNNNSKFASLTNYEKVESQLLEAKIYNEFQDKKFDLYWSKFSKRLIKSNKKNIKLFLPPIIVKLIKLFIPPFLYNR